MHARRSDQSSSKLWSVSQIATMAFGGTDTTRVAGFIEEVLDGEWMGVVIDEDSGEKAKSRRMFRVDVAMGSATKSDVSDLLTGREPYPGVVVYDDGM